MSKYYEKKITLCYSVAPDAVERCEKIDNFAGVEKMLDDVRQLCLNESKRRADKAGWNLGEADFHDVRLTVRDYVKMTNRDRSDFEDQDDGTIIGGYIRYLWTDEDGSPIRIPKEEAPEL